MAHQDEWCQGQYVESVRYKTELIKSQESIDQEDRILLIQGDSLSFCSSTDQIPWTGAYLSDTAKMEATEGYLRLSIDVSVKT